MKKLIVPTDFSDCAEYALEVAAQIARKQADSEIHLVHFYERPISGITLQFSVDNEALHELKEQIKVKMNELANRDYMKGVRVISHYVPDHDITELPKLDLVPGAHLIVMGSHGVKGVKEYFIGSNTQRIAQLSDIPVLVIKSRHEEFTMRNIIFASNFYSEVDLGYNRIKKLGTMFSSNVHLLKINTRNNFEPTHYTHQLMDGFAQEVGLKSYTKHIYNDNTVEEGVLHYAHEVGADIIAMETHGRTGVAHLINGSVTEHIVNHLDMPVLSVKMEEPERKYGVIFPKTAAVGESVSSI